MLSTAGHCDHSRFAMIRAPSLGIPCYATAPGPADPAVANWCAWPGKWYSLILDDENPRCRLRRSQAGRRHRKSTNPASRARRPGGPGPFSVPVCRQLVRPADGHPCHRARQRRDAHHGGVSPGVRAGGTVRIETPHYTDFSSFLRPTHKSHLNSFSFRYFGEEPWRVRLLHEREIP